MAKSKRWRLVKGTELYDLANDPAESYDVAPEHPDIVRDLQARIERLIAGFPVGTPMDTAWAMGQNPVTLREKYRGCISVRYGVELELEVELRGDW